MSTGDSGAAFLKANFGLKVSRATATLPQTAAQNIFSVTGGRVLLTGIVGEVTTVLQALANNTKLTAAPTVGTAVDLCAVVDVTGLEVGGKLGLAPSVSATPFSLALAKQTAGAVPYGFTQRGIVLAVGNLALNCAASATGSIKWDLTYIPLDTGAAMAAL